MTPPAVALLAVTLALPATRPAHAQEPRPGRDSLSRDSVRRDSTAQDTVRRESARYKGHHAMQGVLYAAIFAPAGIVYFAEERRQPSRLGFWRDHASRDEASTVASTTRPRSPSCGRR